MAIATAADANRQGALGDQFLSAGAFGSAETAYRRALDIARELGLLSNQCLWLGNLGIVYFHLRDPQQSIECLREALTVVEQLDDAERHVDLLDKLGISYHLAGLHKSSINTLFQALHMAEADGQNTLLARVHGHLANVFSYNGAYHKAQPHYLTAVDLAQASNDDLGIALWLGGLGNNYLGLQQYNDAIEHFERALQKCETIREPENEAKWRAGLETAKQHSRQQDSVRSRAIAVGASNWAGPFAFDALALRLAEVSDIREKIQLVQAQQSAIAETLDDAIRNSSPEHALSLIDCSKSLISRELLHQKRSTLAGLAPADLLLNGTEWNPIVPLLTSGRESNVAVVTFYYTESCEFYAFIAYLRHLIPHVEKVVLFDGNAGKNFHAALHQLAEIRRTTPFAALDELVLNLVNDIGEAILPRLERIEGIRKTLLLPYKLLHLLPLHIMMQTNSTGIKMLEEIGPTTYTSSLNAYGWRAKLPGSRNEPKRRVLALIDGENLAPAWTLERRVYQDLREFLASQAGEKDAVVVADSAAEFSSDLGLYEVISWSGHGYSDPSDWSRSFLQMGERRFSAREIFEDWKLWNTTTVILSCCETGADKSIDGSIDDYFGLDMAIHAAGAKTVMSTLWPVEETVAGLVSMALAEGVVKHRESPSEVLRQLRFDLVTGQWKDAVEANYRSLSQSDRQKHSDLFAQLLEMDRNAFQGVNSWANWRTFGSW